MKRDLADILVCSVCKGELTLSVGDEIDGEILSGTLTCTKSGVKYPIEDGIPNMLPVEHCEAGPEQKSAEHMP